MTTAKQETVSIVPKELRDILDPTFYSRGDNYTDPDKAKSLKQLQRMNLLPVDEDELKKAFYLISECSSVLLADAYPCPHFSDQLVMTTIYYAMEEGWPLLYERYIQCKHRKGYDIRDSLNDYLKSLFFPRILRAVIELDADAPLFKIFSKSWSPTSDYTRWLSDTSPLLEAGGLVLCKDKDIAQLAAFSDHWHAILQQATFSAFKHYSDDTWPSLFQSLEESKRQEPHRTLKIPESVLGKSGYQFIARSSHQELIEEARNLNHCVSNYAGKCQMENVHIVSLVNEKGKSLSTLELSLDAKFKFIQLSQHRGHGNKFVSEEEHTAAQWLTTGINKRQILIDFDHLEQQRQIRANATQLNFQSKVRNFIGFDPFGLEGSKKITWVKQLYRKHTPPDFRTNLHDLAHLEKLSIQFSFFGKDYEVQLDLLSKEERAKCQPKITRGLRWKLGAKLPKKVDSDLQQETKSFEI